jgi:2-deoxy-D-gluconate 3-dehydrogenase
MNSLFSLAGRVALVTGGNSGIGRAIACGFASAEASVVIAARDESRTTETVDHIRTRYGTEALGVRVDVRDGTQIRAGVEKALARFGELHILVNNAGTTIRRPPEELSEEEWAEVVDTNLKGAFLFSQAVYPAMKEGGGGKIINIGSMASIFGGARVAPYAASKGGLVQLTRSLAVAWGVDNIQANALLPGWINTPLSLRVRRSQSGGDLIESAIAERTPLKRWGEPGDLVGAAIFLASHASDFVTGVALPVDGGYSVHI